MTTQTRPGSQSAQNEWQLRTATTAYLNEMSMLLVEFPIQLARVNSSQAKVQLIQLFYGKCLHASHGLLSM